MGDSNSSNAENGSCVPTQASHVDLPSAASSPVPKPIELASGSGARDASGVPPPHVQPVSTTSVANEMQRKLCLLGFMPQQEVGGLVLGELGGRLDLDRMKSLWLPKVQKANELKLTDLQILDDERMDRVIKPIDPGLASKCDAIESELQKLPFWRTTQHTLALVRLDDLIVLQNSVNLDRAASLAQRISSNATMEQLLDYSIDLTRRPAPIHHRWIGQNTLLFTSPNHDVRPGNVEVRSVPRNAKGSGDGAVHDVPALVVPLLEGEAPSYCIRTRAAIPTNDGSQKRVWFLTLQNGIHRAYALRSLGFEYMPVLLIDPSSADETGLLMSNWSPERMQQVPTLRPPLLKDFFNSDLTETFELRRSMLCVRISVTVEKFTA